MSDQDELQAWAAANPWFHQNQALAQAAIGIETQLAAHGVPLKDRLAHTTRTLSRAFDPQDEPARRTYQEMVRVDSKLGQRVTEDEYVAAAKR
jgi:hypothetical protein